MQRKLTVPGGLALAIAFALASAHAQDAPRAPDASGTQRVVRIERHADPTAANASLDAACEAAGTRCEIVRRHIQGRPMLGVILEPEPARGVRLAGVTPKGPAAAAGLRTGDVLVALHGLPLDAAEPEQRVSQARAALKGVAAGTPVAVRYVRGGQTSDVRVTPRDDVQVIAWNDDHAGLAAHAPVVVRRIRKGGAEVDADGFDGVLAPEAMRVIRQELHRVGDGCKGPACRAPVLMEAFRWNGVNLASVDSRLGRYFGAQRGVLVLSPGEVLDGLEAGDVIQRIDTVDVDTPRAAMDAMRAKPADTPVAVTYLRDRTSRTTQVTVPRAPDMAALMAPPAPPAAPTPGSMPAPPAPPAPPASDAVAPPAPPAAPAPLPAPAPMSTARAAARPAPGPASSRHAVEMAVRTARSARVRVD